MKRLYKSRTDKMLDGVCGGLANYLKVDSVVLRILWVVGTFFVFHLYGVIAYIIAMIVIPREPKPELKFRSRRKANDNDNAKQTAHQDSQTAHQDEDVIIEDAEIIEDEQSTSFEEDDTDETTVKDNQDSATENNKELSLHDGQRVTLWFGAILILIGSLLLVERFMGYDIRSLFTLAKPYFWPSLLIFIGLLLIFRKSER